MELLTAKTAVSSSSTLVQQQFSAAKAELAAAEAANREASEQVSRLKQQITEENLAR